MGKSQLQLAAKMRWLFMLLLGAAFARPAEAAQISDGCMQDVAGFNLNCTANDIRIASVSNITVLDDGCAFPGDTVTFNADLEVLLTAEARYDVGIYISTD